MAIKTVHLTYKAAMFSLWHVILKNLQYPLVITMLTQVECETITKLVLHAGLLAVGVVCTLASTVIHGLHCYQGLDIISRSANALE